MSEKASEDRGRLGFLDSLGRLFQSRKSAGPGEPPTPAPASDFTRLEEDFQSAIRELNDRIAEQRRSSVRATGGVGADGSAEERAKQKARRVLELHEAIREDIAKMHARLGTGISEADLDPLSDYLNELDAVATAGRDSQELIPRARHAIAERLNLEAGERAVVRLVALLRREGLAWPDPIHHHPKATPEAIERARQRRLSDVRELFLAQDLRRGGERLQGIVRGWGSDYPDRGSPLWEESVLEGVAAGIRAGLLRTFVEQLREDRELLLSRTEQSVGKQLAALQAVLEGGIHSVEQAKQAVSSSLRVLDEVVPGIAWELLEERLPEARGEDPQP